MGGRRLERRALRERNEARCRRILDTAEPLVLDDLPWDRIGDVRLDQDVLDVLVYMRDVEGFTDRDLVGLTAHRTTLSDPILAAFLDLWRHEESIHCQAVGRFLREYGEATGTVLPARQHPPPALAPLRERIIARIGGPVGRVVSAAHMAWGAANELLTLNGYKLLAQRAQHPVLTELLHRIAAQEARHYSFYLLQAEWRLATSRSARWFLPRVLDGAWTPVGIGEGYKSRAEFDHVLGILIAIGDAERLVERMDRRFAALPGFAHLRIFTQATGRAPQPA